MSWPSCDVKDEQSFAVPVAERKQKAVSASAGSGGGGVWSGDGGGNGPGRQDESTWVGSAEWLRRHGLVARRLGFYDVLAGAAFRHEDGVLDLKVAPPCDDDQVMDAVSMIIVCPISL